MIDYWREWRGVRLKVMRDNGGVITFGRPSPREWEEIEAMQAEGLIERMETEPGRNSFRLRPTADYPGKPKEAKQATKR